MKTHREVVSIWVGLTLWSSQSFADSNFLNALNKTVARVNEIRDQNLQQQMMDQQNNFNKKTEHVLNKNEIEALKNDLNQSHYTPREEVEAQYRETLAEKLQRPVPEMEKSQLNTLKETSSSMVLATVSPETMKNISTASNSRALEETVVTAEPENKDANGEIVKASKKSLETNKNPEIAEDQTETDKIETVYVDSEQEKAGSYKLPKNLTQEQLLIEKVIDHQNSSLDKDEDPTEDTGLFKQISNAYLKRYKNFSKRIEEKP